MRPAEPEVTPVDPAAGPTVGSIDTERNTEARADEIREASAGRPRRLRATVGAAVVLLLAAGAFSRSPFFGADTIRVRGTDHLTRDDVLRIAGIGQGTNVLYLNGGSVENRLEQQPWIDEAGVDRDLPGTILIRIRERRPVAVVDRDGSPSLVADDGTILGPGPAGALPSIEAAIGAPDLDGRAIAAGARTLAAIPPAMRDEVSAVELQRGGLVQVDLVSGVTASLGAGRDLVRKAQALAAVLRYVEERRLAVATIDVSAPSAPTATLTGGGVAVP
jgi:cell division protein FtsQ